MADKGNFTGCSKSFDKSPNIKNEQHTSDPKPPADIKLQVSSAVESGQRPQTSTWDSPRGFLPSDTQDEVSSGEASFGRKSSASGSTTDRVFPIKSAIGVDPHRSPQALPRGSPSIEYFSSSNNSARGSAENNAKSNESLGDHQQDELLVAARRGPPDDITRLTHPAPTAAADISGGDSSLHNFNTVLSGSKPQIPREKSEPTELKSEEIAKSGFGKDYISAHKESVSGLVTSRFKHITTEEGHCIITGLDIEPIKRCEDEPIHIPGAVQGFGLLVALEGKGEDQLIVRVVSENSHLIIGYTPGELFNLDNFCDILTEEQQDNLLDHIDFIQDGETDLASTGPDVFTISILTKDSPRINRKLWCALHINPSHRDLIICEFELDDDETYPLVPTSEMAPEAPEDTLNCDPTDEEYIESTFNQSKPLRVLRNARKHRGDAANVEVYSIMSQVQDQLASAPNLERFLKILVGVVKELTGFHRVMIYQFDTDFHGRVVTELVDPRATKDLYRGLNFPASDIPKQARDLYKINRVRLLYDRDLTTARLVCRSAKDLERPLDLTFSYLRAMSPIHLKYLANMAVRSSMSISINAFNELWGLISCHSYGSKGMRVSFPLRNMCRLIGDTASQNIERLSYASRLQARKLINTVSTEAHPSGYIVVSSDDLLDLFDADFGLLTIRKETKILGYLEQSQEALAMLEYLRMRKITSVFSSQNIKEDFPDLHYPPGFSIIAGLLLVPLNVEGDDFIVLFRRSHIREVKVWQSWRPLMPENGITFLDTFANIFQWAGNPYEKVMSEGTEAQLQPRSSFKTWSETVSGKCSEWTEDQIETAAVLCLVYGKFIKVWDIDWK